MIGNALVTTPDGSPNNVPLNVTTPNVAGTTSLTATGTSQSITKTGNAQSIELISLLTNGGVVYVKFGYGSAETASATVFDELLNPGDRVQLGYLQSVTHISYIGSGADVVKVIER